jgi:glycosyltransferase involved in cell wall biosynthesis
MRVLLLEPFWAGSHATWAEGLRRHSSHEIRILSLPGRNWKWRMHGGAVSLARRFLETEPDPDLLLATSLLDLTTFRALTGHRTATTPAVVYFHENQFAYPPSPREPSAAAACDGHYGFIHHSSALAADACWFNSDYNRTTLLAGIRDLLSGMPDKREMATVEEVAERSHTLPLGLELTRFDAHRPVASPGEPPLVLWSHRWEHDKNPEGFFSALGTLAQRGVEFQLAVLGAAPRGYPAIFDEARRQLGDRVVHFGHADRFADYAYWVWRADVLPVTSYHDFFGMSVMEAMYCRTLPLLPRRMAYPEILPGDWHDTALYDDPEELVERLQAWLTGPRPDPTPLAEHAAGYDWSVMAPRYDAALAHLARAETQT